MKETPVTVFTGRHMLMIMVAFFGVVIAVNITMASLATSTFSGLLAKNGYVASIDYADLERAKEVAATNGWTVSTRLIGGSLHITAVDREGSALPLSQFAEAAPQGSVLEPRALEVEAHGEGARTKPALPAGDWAVRFRVGEGADRINWRAVVTVAP